MTTEPNSICGLPQHLQCYAQALSYRGGAMQPGTDIPVDFSVTDQFVMTLQVFACSDPIHGLLMFDRKPLRPDEPGIAGPEWFYFGYRCDRCHKTFLLPYWAHEKEDLPRAVHHSCHGGMDIDEVPRQGIRQLANEVAVQILDRMVLHDLQLVDKKSVDYLGHLIAHRFGQALESFWQGVVNLAIEKAQGRRG